MNSPLLSPAQCEAFQRDGLLIVPGFYDLERDILPIQRGIYDIIGLVIDKYRLPISRLPFSAETFDSGYQALIAANRAYGGEVYDAVKQIPAFVRLVAHPLHDCLFRELRGEQALPGVAAGGYGIRIDNPGEERFRANWHQEYPAQLRSLDGLVYWSPLLEVSEALGPVQFCLASHRDGLVPVHASGSGGKTQAYALTLQDEQARIARYAQVAPLTEPGDLVIVDFLLLHASGFNRAQRSRWSMQLRYFNFNEPTGRAHGWKGSFAAGVDFRSIHPELCADREAE
ncbi:phytanoyl-CoA dioxygenase family protein [Pseudomonas sp. JS3066]|uniref:phytanoyl-CoA dioxygenase family protein n=1 Tax=unclassified Pseudomonas TaxID=196821 RepID=UPI0021157F99|nr:MULTISPECIES: phytanoyl-CoA dioxygenase family protein [unclassified Pseudomonas]WVK91533.1 phytanoyl-CoA dioxygenase family protein [Pseudomonas sp. JS3066]